MVGWLLSVYIARFIVDLWGRSAVVSALVVICVLGIQLFRFACCGDRSSGTVLHNLAHSDQIHLQEALFPVSEASMAYVALLRKVQKAMSIVSVSIHSGFLWPFTQLDLLLNPVAHIEGDCIFAHRVSHRPLDSPVRSETTRRNCSSHSEIYPL
jgi:hypothetical protein